MIPYSRQSISKQDIASVSRVLKSNFLTQGPLVEKFEKKMSNVVRSKYAVASNSGSSALHLACLSLGLGSKDIVWTVPNTFAATANCAINCGAIIDFVDIDSDTLNISIDSLKKKLIYAKRKKKLPKILIPVHFAGQTTEQKIIWNLSKKYNFKVIEDASHSIGAKHYGEPVGSCKWSDITVFSFHPVKIITTAEGGMSLTNDKRLADKMKMYRTNGIIKDSLNLKIRNSKPWYYEQKESGFNYRMNDISAALGLSQLKRLKRFLRRRNEIAKIYKKLLKDSPVKFQKILNHNHSSYHLFIAKFDLKKSKYNYKYIFKKLRSKNFFVNLHYMPLHLSPFFKGKGFRKGQFPISENYARNSLSLPIFFDLKKEAIKKICRTINSFF